mmetsp:Transcript_19465/g.73537  ORF Transcript_19465/g.73537 Transcript_19465/m.73537 type:complete len:284 (-) Transcript_19465:598-1449(-)|eukprot:scaffold8431_cov248-Pinguiococcus_pyrenoidosus.AAC.8
MRLKLALQGKDLGLRGHVAVLLLKVLQLRKLLLLDEVEERPQFLRVVLERRSRHQHSMLVSVGSHSSREDVLQALQQLRHLVSQPVRLVDHDGVPRDGHQMLKVFDEVLVCRQEDLKLQEAATAILPVPLILTNDVAHLPAGAAAARAGASIVVDADPHVGPAFEFPAPVFDGTQWNHDEEGALHALHAEDVLQETDDLHSLAESHFVREDAPPVAIVAPQHPVQALHLVVAELPPIAVLPGLLVELLPPRLPIRPLLLVGRCSHQRLFLVLPNPVVADRLIV